MRLGLIVVMLLLMPAAPGQLQPRMDADRSASIPAPPGILDVVAIRYPVNADNSQLSWTSTYGVADEDKLILFSNDNSGRCSLVQMGMAFQEATTCENGRLQGILDDLLLVCFSGPATTSVLVAYDAAGDVAWDVVPDRDFPRPDRAESLPQDVPGADWSWGCDGAAIVDDAVVAPFLAVAAATDGARNRVARIAADGTIQWHRAVARLDLPDAPTEDGRSSFLPLGVTASTSGYVVTGLVPCVVDGGPCRSAGGESGFMGAVAWLDLSGRPMNLEVPRPKDDVSTEAQEPLRFIPVVSSFGAAEGRLVAVLVGGRALLIDPALQNPEWSQELDVRETGSNPSRWPAPFWQDHRLAIPTDRAVIFLDPVTYGPVTQGEPLFQEGDHPERVADVIGDNLGRLFVLTATMDNTTSATTPGTHATVWVLDRDGDDAMSLPVPAVTRRHEDGIFAFQTSGTAPGFEQRQVHFLQTPHFIYHAGALHVVDAAGHMFTLGDRDEEPDVGVSDLYPAANEQITLTVTRFGEPIELWVRWGEGQTDRIPWRGESMQLQHAWGASVRRDVHVTVVDRDGTTATASIVVDVGGTPPPDLNALQKAFSPRYQDTTWGIIGLAVVLLGGLFGLLKVRRYRRRLRKELQRLHEIRDLAHDDPIGALTQLQELRQLIADRAATGHYGQGQLHLLETRAARTARTILFQAVAPFRERLTPVYEGMLSGFFEDGHIGDYEARVAMEGLGKQGRLAAGERRTIEDMVRVLSDAY